ncbi:uncharacterized protein LOC117171123 [Belonocnema kinseyi]|uniref:uncharacterized protein LOC117171123 n=1 Tax=Belonocnema kinseyi TaxID=2817044 RepID=UPI00143DC9AF|nr:uncharacterized protein LOC117171123 [Belonocnema kinseyi]
MAWLRIQRIQLPKNITLADPEFHKPSDIDILIGVKLFYKLLCVGQIKLKKHAEVVLQKTQLGWIVAGEINGPFPTKEVQCHLAINSTPLDSSLTKFWEVEEIPSSKILSMEEKACEAHFAHNTQRNSDGRYIVKLPFNENKSKLGDSLPMASRRFKYLENRVAPVSSNTMTLPRLELCAALLLSQLVTVCKKALQIDTQKIVLWSDSTITLQWIKTEPHTQPAFVANRIAEIQKLTPCCKWSHVPSENNCADLVSRAAAIHVKVVLERKKLLEKYSSMTKLQRHIAYLLRFIHSLKNKTNQYIGPIAEAELDASTRRIIQLTQSTEFSIEISHGILGVGGRLVHSDLFYDQKHPILLPSNHHITRLIIREEHLRLKHSGTQATLYSVREHYWPLDGHNVTCQIIHQCVPCFRAKPRSVDYMVGDLPQKGKSKLIYSDNGKNFVGDNRELNELNQLLLSAEHNKNVQQFLMNERITWHFIPPGAPHFGGLWEAAVKSFKHHLLRTVGDTLLTYEQLETCIIEIEAISNSRPISPISSDPSDLRPLTPGHILIGGPLTSLPQINLSDTPVIRLSVWEHTQKMREHFWERWSREYLNQLIVRSKWLLNSIEDC